jgi:hypothetical protein
MKKREEAEVSERVLVITLLVGFIIGIVLEGLLNPPV